LTITHEYDFFRIFDHQLPRSKVLDEEETRFIFVALRKRSYGVFTKSEGVFVVTALGSQLSHLQDRPHFQRPAGYATLLFLPISETRGLNKTHMVRHINNSQIVTALLIVLIVTLLLFLTKGTTYAQPGFFGARDIPVAPRIDQEAKALIEAQDWAGAVTRLGELLEAKGPDPSVKYYLAMCYREIGLQAYKRHMFQEAIEQFEKGLTYVDNDPDFYLGLGFCYLKLSEYLEAEAAFIKVLELDHDSYLASKKLGEIYYLTNDIAQALLFWTRALELRNDDASLRRRLSNLRKQMKVSRNFETEVDHLFSVSFDGERNPGLRDTVMEILQDAYYEIGQQLNAYPKRQIAVVLLTRDEFFDITGSPQWAWGIYEGQIKVPVADYEPKSLKKALYHEYTHALIYDIMSQRCPWWLNEGLAQYFSNDHAGNEKKRVLASKLLSQEKAPSLSALPGKIGNAPVLAFRAYALALSAVESLIEMFNLYNLQTILEEMGEGKEFDTAIWETTGYSLKEFEDVWINPYK
jgi:tetratricopeptide (TPR) repeat protein